MELAANFTLQKKEICELEDKTLEIIHNWSSCCCSEVNEPN